MSIKLQGSLVTVPIVYSLRTGVPVQTRGKERLEVRLFLYLGNIYNIYNNYYDLHLHILFQNVWFNDFLDKVLLLKERELFVSVMENTFQL